MQVKRNTGGGKKKKLHTGDRKQGRGGGEEGNVTCRTKETTQRGKKEKLHEKNINGR